MKKESELRREMIEKALRFRNEELWRVLDDSMIFATPLSEGKLGYCCVMGNGGTHYSLGLYRGERGFSTYLFALDMRGEKDPFEVFMTYDCINCDFENVSETDLTAVQKAEIREVAKSAGLKMKRSKGFPDIKRIESGRVTGVSGKEEIEDVIMGLNAGLEVVRKLKELHIDFKNDDDMETLESLGFSGYYPSIEGGDSIPLLTQKEDGSYEWGITKTPGFHSPWPEIRYDNIMTIGRLKALRHEGTWEIKVTNMETPVRIKGGCYYPQIIVLASSAAGVPMPIMSDREGDDTKAMLDKLSFFMLEQEFCPSKFYISDGRTEAALRDMAEKVGITITKVDSLPMVDQLLVMLNGAMNGGFGF